MATRCKYGRTKAGRCRKKSRSSRSRGRALTRGSRVTLREG